MTENIPSLSKILGGVLQSIEPGLQPFLLAKLERLAAQRYRMWASGYTDQNVKEGLLACAEREEEIAKRVESLNPEAERIQARLLSEHPEVLDLNRTLFEGRALEVQFAIQAEGERAGAAAWKAYADASSDTSVQELLQSCSGLEQENAEFLQKLVFTVDGRQ